MDLPLGGVTPTEAVGQPECVPTRTDRVQLALATLERDQAVATAGRVQTINLLTARGGVLVAEDSMFVTATRRVETVELHGGNV